MAERAERTDRRSEILEATCRVIGRSGVNDLRVEDVAKEVGVSPALVYYYFDTRAELLSLAFEFADARSNTHTMKQIDATASGRKQLEDIMYHEFDDSPEVRDNWIIWSEMESSAFFDQALLAAVEKWGGAWKDTVADLIRLGRRDGSITTDVDPEASAERLIAILDGFGPKILLGVMTRDRGRKLIQDAIDIEFGPTPS